MISRGPLESFRYAFPAIFLSFLMAGAWYPSEAAAARKGQQVSAAQLCREMDGALNQIQRSYRPRDPRNDPFLSSVKRADTALAYLMSDLNRKEKRLGSSIGQVGSAVAEIRATFRYMGIKDPKVQAAVAGLTGSWDGFQERFIEKAASTRSRVTAEQQRELQELKAKSNEMDQRLTELRTKVAGDANLANEVRRMAEENRRISQAKCDQAGLMTALTTFNAISGWWHALYWTSLFRHNRWIDHLTPFDRWWSGTEVIFAPAYNEYFVNIDQNIFNEQWIIDHPFSIHDEAVLTGWDEAYPHESDLIQLHDALEHTDGIHLDESDWGGAALLHDPGLELFDGSDLGLGGGDLDF